MLKSSRGGFAAHPYLLSHITLPNQPNTWYFGAGPAMLPDTILHDVAQELFNWQDTGVSILEISHRSREFSALMEETEHALRMLLNIPDAYHVLFLGMPARALFGMIPMNLIRPGGQTAYWVTGHWSHMAYQEALKFQQAVCITHDGLLNDLTAYRWEQTILPANTSYLYYTPNETLQGVYAPKPILCGSLPLIADMTSCLLTEPMRVSDYDLIFAGAQKNISIASMTIVIVKADLLSQIETTLPSMFDFRVHRDYQSLYATPPVFNCYLASKMFSWILEQGGITALHVKNQLKAKKLYDYIDTSSYYTCPVPPANRSMTNICFFLPDPSLDADFLKQANARYLQGLKGHREVGGFRASLYNAMPMEGVERLIAFMDDFRR